MKFSHIGFTLSLLSVYLLAGITGVSLPCDWVFLSVSVIPFVHKNYTLGFSHCALVSSVTLFLNELSTRFISVLWTSLASKSLMSEEEFRFKGRQGQHRDTETPAVLYKLVMCVWLCDGYWWVCWDLCSACFLLLKVTFHALHHTTIRTLYIV